MYLFFLRQKYYLNFFRSLIVKSFYKVFPSVAATSIAHKTCASFLTFTVDSNILLVICILIFSMPIHFSFKWESLRGNKCVIFLHPMRTWCKDLDFCRGKKRDVTGTGYTNLFNRVQSDHPEQYCEASNGATISTAKQTKPQNCTMSSQIESFQWNCNTIFFNGWLQFIVHSLKSFDLCKNNDKVHHMKYPEMYKETFMKYLEPFSKQFEANIAKRLPSNFALMFESRFWSRFYNFYVPSE